MTIDDQIFRAIFKPDNEKAEIELLHQTVRPPAIKIDMKMGNPGG